MISFTISTLPEDLFNPDNLRQGGQPLDSGELKGSSGPSGVIVEHDRQIARFSNRAIVAENPLLGWAIVVGGDNKREIGAKLLGPFGFFSPFRPLRNTRCPP